MRRLRGEHLDLSRARSGSPHRVQRLASRSTRCSQPRTRRSGRLTRRGSPCDFLAWYGRTCTSCYVLCMHGGASQASRPSSTTNGSSSVHSSDRHEGWARGDTKPTSPGRVASSDSPFPRRRYVTGPASGFLIAQTGAAVSERLLTGEGAGSYFPKKARWSCRDCEDDSREFDSASTASSATFRCSGGRCGTSRPQLKRARTFVWILALSRVTSSAKRCNSRTCSSSDWNCASSIGTTKSTIRPR